VTLCVPGAAEIVKSGVAVTFKVAVTVCVKEPLVPVMVIVGLPIGVLDVVVIVRVEVVPGVMGVGLNEGVAPVGRPEALRLTEPLKPFKALTLTVYVVPPP